MLFRSKILDIGTGSGCIALALKKHFKNSDVFACDISEGALDVARENAFANGVKVNFLQQDILQKSNWTTLVPRLPSFDLIVSNPPYVRKSEMEAMHKNVLDFEPHTALFVEDENALKYYEAITDFALVGNLKKNGYLFFEINEEMADDICRMAELKGFSNIQLKKDMRGKDRMLLCQNNFITL